MPCRPTVGGITNYHPSLANITFALSVNSNKNHTDAIGGQKKTQAGGGGFRGLTFDTVPSLVRCYHSSLAQHNFHTIRCGGRSCRSRSTLLLLYTFGFTKLCITENRRNIKLLGGADAPRPSSWRDSLRLHAHRKQNRNTFSVSSSQQSHHTLSSRYTYITNTQNTHKFVFSPFTHV